MNIAPAHIDALKELINIGVGRASGVLNEMLKAHITLQVPFIKILTTEELKQEIAYLGRNNIAAVRLGFKGPFSGSVALVFPTESASKLVSLLTDEEPGSIDLDSVRAGTLSEVGNIVINGVMGSIANVLNQPINYSLPDYIENDFDSLLMPDNSLAKITVLLAQTDFMIKTLHIEGNIILIFEVGSFDALLAAIEKLE